MRQPLHECGLYRTLEQAFPQDRNYFDRLDVKSLADRSGVSFTTLYRALGKKKLSKNLKIRLVEASNGRLNPSHLP